MASITIIGLGPGDPALLTRAAWEALESARSLYLRTSRHPTVAALPDRIALHSFDALYDEAHAFGEIYERIADELVGRAQSEEVIYAVPGHPLVAEATTRHLLALARERQLPVRIIHGLSFVEPVCATLELDPLEAGLQLLDALDLAPPAELAPDAERPGAWSEVQGIGPYTAPLLPFPLAPTRPALICQLYSRRVASDVKLSLLERYPANHPIAIVRAAGVAGQEQVWHVPLHELDHQDRLDHLSCAYVPPLAPLSDLRGPEGVAYVVARLLGPGGCPWDREQTHASLRGALLEEAHEALEALDAGDMEALAEELGDLLLQVLMHSEMARQAGDFDLGDVYEHVAAKLIRRHPHIFEATRVSGSDEVLRNWEAIKGAERATLGRAPRGPLDGIPAGLPALAAAQELARKAARTGFDWPDQRGAWSKLAEEIAELREAASAPDSPDRPGRIEAELGDVLFALANLARYLRADAESALRAAGARFRRRFARVYQQAQAAGQDLNQISLDEKLALWDQTKQIAD